MTGGKPVSMLQEIAEITTKDGNVVLDPFMGSGSTGVTCINFA
jgi:DNA modification methylase